MRGVVTVLDIEHSSPEHSLLPPPPPAPHPISSPHPPQQVALAGHERAVTALDIEHSGARVATGSIDNTVRLYDFGGMKADMRSFR